MAHTNSTTNYSLPQFLPTDKPAWLTDVNGAFSDILKDLETIKAMEEAGYSNTYSGDYSERYTRPMYAYDGNSYDDRGRGRYAERDAMGRYSSEYTDPWNCRPSSEIPQTGSIFSAEKKDGTIH